MKTFAKYCTAALMILAVIGCEVTEEKIELWKGTQNGEEKLSEAAVNKDLAVDLRAKALVALVEINSWNLFRDTLKTLAQADKEDVAKVTNAIAPMLAKMISENTETKKGMLNKLQVDAKDGLVLLLEYVTGAGQEAAHKALIAWCSVDYNIRAKAGQYSIRTIVKKVGVSGADGIMHLLKRDEVVLKPVAELIREVNEPKVLEKASQVYAKELTADLKKIHKSHIEVAIIIGGTQVTNALIDIATSTNVGAELQRYALRAISVGIEKKSIVLTDKQLSLLNAMADNEAYDKVQREETYYTIAQVGQEAVLPRFLEMQSSKDSFARAVSLRCILRIDGEGQLASTVALMARKKLTKTSDDVNEVIMGIARFPNLLPNVRQLVDNRSAFVKAIAVYVLAQIGTAEDLKILETLTTKKTRTPKGFEHKNIGDAAKAAVAAIKERG